MKIAVFVSGSGSNLQNIIDAIQDGSLPNTEIAMVMADRDCYAVERSLDYDIPTFLLEEKKTFSEDADHNLEGENIDLIVLAGFLSILSKEFVEKWQGKIINIHPALLPKYGGKGMYGKHVHQAVLDAGDQVSGATVHFVTAGVDEGEIILQGEFAVEKTDEIADLQRKVAEVEKEIMIQAIQKLTEKIG
ncbi:phosphoribosylglycinamide formyltransferase [Moheibacter lacus]|uniref:Phosphoribosylglycinamide formyltransferase n=1 Tax=Moheibacter lacus TaxID=2745851 RepID=A0A838ZQS1_9FLAO|nr:phosphoribosylglycinamide formyltransferase [Moheibacter lacus]MBA5628223.1 phosphoribosylglycinamide formyltransferase [Moheibacter lacus]